MIDDKRLAAIRAHIASGRYPACYAPELLDAYDALNSRLEVAEARASAVEGERAGLRSALEHIEVITREEMGWMYAGQRTNAAESAHKIAKCVLDAYAAPSPAAEEVTNGE